MRLERHYTPRHGIWLNMAEIEFAALSKQCLGRRTGSIARLTREVAAWEEERNERTVSVKWRFTTPDPRMDRQIAIAQRIEGGIDETRDAVRQLAGRIIPGA